ncbi:MAG: 7-cyano-7-deazaguanine synthase [Elusimicrobia bacterium]|nr:7-cyano-7-deazaguanine synthase [Elusimicrobiota bacterium]
MTRQQKAVVLASGGMDSAALLGWALRRYTQVQPVYSRFGLRWERAELYWLKKFLHAIKTPRLLPLEVLEVSTKNLYANHWSRTGKHVPGYRSSDPAVYLPGRNALLLSQAAVYAATHRCSDILIGTLSGNPFPDATLRFFKTMERALSIALGTPLHVQAPFRRMTKQTVLRSSRHLPLTLAFSCLNPRGHRPCHTCNKCAEHDRAIKSQ